MSDAARQFANAPRHDPIFWTLPWCLAAEHRDEIHERAEWPHDLFQVFEDALRNVNVMESDGAHTLLEVLYEFRASLSPHQRATLGGALDTPALRDYPTWVASCRLHEHLGGQRQLEAIFRDCVKGVGANEMTIGNAIGLFKKFTITSALDLTSTRCRVETEQSGEWDFTIDESYKILQSGKPSDPMKRDDLITSNIRSDDDIGWVQHTIEVLPAYEPAKRVETLFSLPDALANTQKLNSELLGWHAPTFKAFLDSADVMNEHGIDPEARFKCLLEALEKPCRAVSPRQVPSLIFSTLNSAQKSQLLNWLGAHAGQFDPDTANLVARFITARYPADVATRFFTSMSENADVAFGGLSAAEGARRLVSAGRHFQRLEEKGRLASPSRSSVSRPHGETSMSPAPEREQSAPAKLGRRLGNALRVIPPFTGRSLSASPRSETPKDQK